MLKLSKLILLTSFFLGINLFGAPMQQVDLIGPTNVEINHGWTNVEFELPQPIEANPFRILFWITNECKVIPMANLSIKYQDMPYWFATDFKQGFYHSTKKGLIESVKFDFYQTNIHRENCILKLSGYLNLANVENENDENDPLPPPNPPPPGPFPPTDPLPNYSDGY